MHLEGARLGLRGLDPDQPARQRRPARREVGDETPAGGVRRRVDQPFLARVPVEDFGDLGKERRLEPLPWANTTTAITCPGIVRSPGRDTPSDSTVTDRERASTTLSATA